MTIDWKNAPEGATHYSPETDTTHAVFYKDDFKQMWIEKWSNLGWQEAHSLNEHERPIPRPTSTGIPVSEQTQTLEAELSALRTAAIADAAEIERLDQCIGELRLELSKCQERNDELCIANHDQTVKISKIRKVISEN